MQVELKEQRRRNSGAAAFSPIDSEMLSITR